MDKAQRIIEILDNKRDGTVHGAFMGEVADELAALRAENARLRASLEPSGDTKAAYMGEIRDPDTKRDVSWTAIKMIMRMISDRAAKEALK